MANPPSDYNPHDELGELDPDDPGARDDLREWLERQGMRPTEKTIQDLLRRLKSTKRRLLGR